MFLVALPIVLFLSLSFRTVLLLPVLAYQPHSVYEDFFGRPQFQVYFTKNMVRESDVANAGPESNLVVLPGPSGARWACRIPDVTEEVEEETVERRDPEVERREAEGKLEPMKSGCLYYLQGWFTYEYCQWVDILLRREDGRDIWFSGSTERQ